jgi:uncharacterized repeat protein (TIGR03803 family)
MRTSKSSTSAAVTLTIIALTLTGLITPKRASSQTETVLHAFQSTEKYDGFSPNAPLIADAKGNLYGTTATGGEHGWGIVFKLAPPSAPGGTWTENVLYSFTGGSDGGFPSPGQLLLKGGSLYGTAAQGGANGVGVVFELSPGKPWVETVLYSFTTSAGYGFTPSSGLTQGSKGTFYGTTFKGGAHKQGVVYRLSPPTGGGAWTEAPIYAFKGGSTDGSEPGNNLITDSTGSLYGVTLVAPGTAFKLTPSGTGAWTETVLYTFNPAIEGPPNSSLVFDSTGALYGVTNSNGASGGTVFQLTPPTGGGAWTKNTLYSFQGSPSNDGATPTGAIFDSIAWSQRELRRGRLRHHLQIKPTLSARRRLDGTSSLLVSVGNRRSICGYPTPSPRDDVLWRDRRRRRPGQCRHRVFIHALARRCRTRQDALRSSRPQSFRPGSLTFLWGLYRLPVLQRCGR